MKKSKVVVLVLSFVLVFILSISSIACNKSNDNSKEMFTVTVVNGTGGATVAKNKEITITATVPSGQEFDAWLKDNQKVSTNNPYTFKVTSNITLTATFKSEDPLSGKSLKETWEAGLYWMTSQPLYFIGDKILPNDYKLQYVTDDRANDVEDFTSLVKISKEDSDNSIVITNDGFILSEEGSYTISSYAIKGDYYCKADYKTKVVTPTATTEEGKEFNNAAKLGNYYIVKRVIVDGSLGSIDAERVNFSYVAFKGEYGAGSWISTTFTGKNRPNFGFFFDADKTMCNGSADNKGIYIGEFGSEQSKTFYNRMTSFDYASIAVKRDIGADPVRPFTFDCRGNKGGTSSSPNGVFCAYDQLDDNKNYEFVIGMEEGDVCMNFTLQLYEINNDNTKTLIYLQSREIEEGDCKYLKTMKGDITIYGNSLKDIKFNAKLLSEEEIPAYKTAAFEIEE